jgi:hypothetical protein
MSGQFRILFNRYLSEERLDCKKYLSHYLMTNRVERPSEYLMDEFVQRALGLEDRVLELRDRLSIAQECIEKGYKMNTYRRKLNVYLEKIRRESK